MVRIVLRRSPRSILSGGMEVRTINEIDSFTSWSDALDQAEVAVHLAARVHMMRDASIDPLSEFRRINVEGTLNFARQAADAGVRRFIFLSSVKVNGESGIFRETDAENPQDAYAISKYEAEIGLRRIAAETGMAVTIIRPPLVYGLGARANFEALVRIVKKGIPLPLAAIDNRRSLVAIDNLVDMIVTCIDHPAAENEIFLVSDGEDLSTPDLVRRIARALNRPARLFSVSPDFLMTAAGLVCKREAALRLVSSLQVDIDKARVALGWTPPFTVDEGLSRAVG